MSAPLTQAEISSAIADEAAARDAAIAAAVGGEQPAIIQSHRSRDFLGTAQTWPVANQAHLFRFRVDRECDAVKISYLCAVASGNVDGGVFRLDGATYTLLGSSGSIAAAGTNAIQELTITPTVPLVPFVDYYGGMSADNTTLQIVRVMVFNYTAIANYTKDVIVKSSLFPLATFTTPGVADRALWLGVVTQ